MSELIAYDSATPRLIPASAQAVLPYSDGRFRWSNRLFPHAAWRYITCLGDPKADIADVEDGCIWPPAEVRVWAEARLRLGITDLTIYCDRSNYPAVEVAMAGLDWHLFLATLDFSQPTEYLGRRLRAVQYTDRNNAYDMSLIYDHGWLNAPPDPAAPVRQVFDFNELVEPDPTAGAAAPSVPNASSFPDAVSQSDAPCETPSSTPDSSASSPAPSFHWPSA